MVFTALFTNETSRPWSFGRSVTICIYSMSAEDETFRRLCYIPVGCIKVLILPPVPHDQAAQAQKDPNKTEKQEALTTSDNNHERKLLFSEDSNSERVE